MSQLRIVRWFFLGRISFGLSMLLFLSSIPLSARESLRDVAIFDDGEPHLRFARPAEPGFVERSFPFCPSDREPCTLNELAWVQLQISNDAYSARRNDAHDSIARILSTTREDLAPLVVKLAAHFAASGSDSDVAKVAFVQGLVEAVRYEKDAATGWTEYPKFGLEFLWDEQGDCDDASIVNTLLLAELGYRSYFVSWSGKSGGHLSTAIEPNQGDLRSFQIPDGSRWIEASGFPRLIHVDATGTTGGCGKVGKICGSLGFNEWHEEGLAIEAIVAQDDPNLDGKLSITAWNNGGRERPDTNLVDRRGGPSDPETREDLLDADGRQIRLRQRLARAGIDPAAIEIYLRPRYPFGLNYYYAFLSFCASIILILFGATWSRHRKRRKRSQAAKSQRKAAQF